MTLSEDFHQFLYIQVPFAFFLFGAQRVRGILLQFAADHIDHHGSSDTGRAAHGYRSRIGSDLPFGVGIHCRVAILRREDAAFSHACGDGTLDHVDHCVDAHARAAADRRGCGDARESIRVIRADLDRPALNGHVLAGGRLRRQFGDIHADRAADRRAGSTRDTGGRRHRLLGGVCQHLCSAACAQFCACCDIRLSLPIIIGNHGYGRYRRRSGDRRGGCRVDKRGICVRAHGQVSERVRTAGKAHFIGCVKYSRVGTHRNRSAGAAAEGHGQKPQIVIRHRADLDVSGGFEISGGLCCHFLRKSQHDNSRSAAHAAGEGQRAGAVKQVGVIERLDPDIARTVCCSIFGIPRRKGCALHIRTDHIFGDHGVDHPGDCRAAAAGRAGDSRHDDAFTAGRADIDAVGAGQHGSRSQLSRVRKLCDHVRLIDKCRDHRPDCRTAAGDGHAARGVHQHGIEIRLNSDIAIGICLE